MKEIWVNDELVSIDSFWIDSDENFCEGTFQHTMGMMSTKSITLSKTGVLIDVHPDIGCCERVLYTSACDGKLSIL